MSHKLQSPGKRALIATYLACPVCKGSLRVSDSEASCSTCEAVYPIADEVLVLLPAGQGEALRRLRARYEATVGGTSLPSVFRVTKRMLGSVTDRAVLDVGCSQGQFSFDHLLPQRPRAIIGVDFSSGAIHQAQRRAAEHPNVLFVVGDATALPVASNRFDKVIITEVIEHLPDVQSCLAELRRSVTDTGDIVLSTPNYFNPVGIWKLIFDRVYHKGHERWTYADHSEELEHFQTPFSIQRQLRLAKLTISDFRGTDLWMGVRKAILVPWLLFDHGLRRLLNLFGRDLLSRTLLKYFGVVQYYRLRKQNE
jgi:2-polyprenyl-3-methyl-5-hydroxy-6-metoxy-1,4-benzoquinol methylase/uncharacterized protein YbaR (Trm112 family)